MASRPIKDSEAKDCLANGVESYTQIKIGYDGVLLAYRGDSGFGNLSLTGRQIWLAMAKNVPVNGAMVANPYKNWSDIDPSLPASPILFFLPEKGVAMRDLFGDLVLKGVCAEEPLLAALADEAREEACLAPREDGAILDFAVSRDALTSLVESADQPLTLTNIQLMSITPGAKDAKLVNLDGIAPDSSSISAGTYKASRSHYLYVEESACQSGSRRDGVRRRVPERRRPRRERLSVEGWLDSSERQGAPGDAGDDQVPGELTVPIKPR